MAAKKAKKAKRTKKVKAMKDPDGQVVLPQKTVEKIIKKAVADMFDSYEFAVKSAVWQLDGTAVVSYVQKSG